MIVNVRMNDPFIQVVISDGGATIDLGLLDENERDEVASALIDGVVAMGPVQNDDCQAWLAKMLARHGFTFTVTWMAK